VSVWVSVGPDIPTLTYENGGHRPSRDDEDGPRLTLAYVPSHISKGVWVRVAGSYPPMVLGRRAATQLRDTLTAILDGERR
jgi:hypothetical protein